MRGPRLVDLELTSARGEQRGPHPSHWRVWPETELSKPRSMPAKPVSLDYYDQAPFKFNGKIEQVQVKYTK